MREFGLGSKSPMHRVELLQGGLHDGFHYSLRHLTRVPLKSLASRDSRHHTLSRLFDLVRLFPESLRQGKQHALKTGSPVAIIRWKVCSPKERPAITR